MEIVPLAVMQAAWPHPMTERETTRLGLRASGVCYCVGYAIIAAHGLAHLLDELDGGFPEKDALEGALLAMNDALGKPWRVFGEEKTLAESEEEDVCSGSHG